MSECPFLNNLATPNALPHVNNKRPRNEDVDETATLLTCDAMPNRATHYGDYLGIQTLTSLQDGLSPSKPEGRGLMHHEELNFIIIHQVFELWFKLVLADMGKCRAHLKDITKVDSDTFYRRLEEVNRYMCRAEKVFSHVTGAFSIMETMHAADFVEFRDYLSPASGFQSVQFRLLEQLLGLQRVSRSLVNGREVLSFLTPEEQEGINKDNNNPSLNDLILTILNKVNVPGSFRSIYFTSTEKVMREHHFDIAKAPIGDPIAEKKVESGLNTLKAMLDNPVEWSEGYHCANKEEEDRYKRAVLAALFITSYRHDPLYAMLATFLDNCVAVEEATLIWRGRHMNMAERMIGRRAGTGGTGSGVGYLEATSHYRIFHCLWLVRKLFTRASALPPSKEVFGTDPMTLFYSE